MCNKLNESTKFFVDSGKVVENRLNYVEQKVDKLAHSKPVGNDSRVGGINSVINEYKCRECEETFGKRWLLRKHIVSLHPKNVRCDTCFLEFNENWKLEEHMAVHTNQKKFACEICDKQFVLKWRLRKHMNTHLQNNIKFCHFFNNNKVCHFERISGCMFRHDDAPQCIRNVNTHCVNLSMNMLLILQVTKLLRLTTQQNRHLELSLVVINAISNQKKKVR